jgi:hypothetical protein
MAIWPGAQQADAVVADLRRRITNLARNQRDWRQAEYIAQTRVAAWQAAVVITPLRAPDRRSRSAPALRATVVQLAILAGALVFAIPDAAETIAAVKAGVGDIELLVVLALASASWVVGHRVHQRLLVIEREDRRLEPPPTERGDDGLRLS